MKKYLPLLVLVLTPVLYAQDLPVEEGSELSAGKSATLGVEASTAFAWDIENKSTGLETKVGMELIFPLFPHADRGLYPDNFDSPAVRIALKNAAFTWWNVYETKGGNYEQDNFNNWTARPLVLSFDSFSADVVWTNYFLRVASSTTAFQTDQVSLFSLFDDVMDANDRWYVSRNATRALWTTDRYNIQNLPLLKDKIVRNYIDEDYRTVISGNLAFGAEFEKVSAALKAASNKNGRENNDNAWLFGADIEVVPVERLKFGLTGFAGFNYEKTSVGKNPVNLGAVAEYRMAISDYFFLTPRVGFDFAMDTATNENAWEMGAGIVINTRGLDFLASSRILDWDEVIPVGASAFMNMNQDNGCNVMVSWFDPAGPDSLLPNFGGFLQLELADLTGKNNGPNYGILAQFEYLIAGKFLPYIRGRYVPEFQAGSTDKITGDYVVTAALGCYMMPIHFFSVDLRYDMDTKLLEAGGTEAGGSLLSIVFTVRM